MALRQSPKAKVDAASAAIGAAAAAARAGDGQTALRILLQAAHANPSARALYRPLARHLADMRFSEASPAVKAVVARVLTAPGVDPQPLAPAAISLLKAEYDLTAAAPDDLHRGLWAEPLLLTLLERALLPDAGLEALLTRTRLGLLATPGRPAALPALLTALARQALLNGWMWRETAAELAALAALRAELEAAAGFGPAHLVYGLYRPLTDLAGIAGLAAAARGPWRAAAAALVIEPLEERRLAARLPSLGHVPNAATAAVKAQYEAFPYPRWTANGGGRTPRPIGAVAAELFPHGHLPDWPKGRLDVLIAGCGTGKHAADVAARFQGASVLAVDLSLTALGYGARMLKGTGAVRFAEADIMALGSLEQRFDHIESVGVLHHLSDPLGGWRVLKSLLRPGGTMRVGFYCRRGRARVVAAREALQAAGFHGRDDADLRAARAHALDAPPGSDAWLATRELDFYAASGARDFLFHAQEAEYRPAELADMVEALGLSVIGLELTDPGAAALYRARFPDDKAMADLRRWDAIETDHPDIFRHMCQFWTM